ncbi:Ribosomal RNA small subunit methyltransferase D [Candidatus Annandia adelgestsuga]|uniref:Ribosomal RNA small subunit methyltransferase D n=1 Tax=Candidatus Annandia adelgestsuga TaxID=1302411 RepID=A0A3S9J7Q2_9ENTR|nr:16S rRNA (guanine(966)-N(2))-methyltransferase RsmD [Candidatus Annandia adelgestsuga]AZP36279.1 Ribosomal RNA small subunit methyltransferase D [Candidatus Annandia adelgestsuga]
MKNNKIHIISGKFYKRKLLLINNKQMKPTTNFMRKTLFNWLKNNLKNYICLDCFAGSGVLGLESLSHNAKKIIFIENNYNSIKKLKKNISFLKIKKNKIIYNNTLDWLMHFGNPQNIVFIDPPFKDLDIFLIEKLIFILEKYNWLKSGSFIYIEHSYYKKIIIPKNFLLYKKKKKKSIYNLYIKN